MNNKKELYVAVSFEALETHYNIMNQQIKKIKIPALCNSASKLIEVAERSYLDGDEEKCFIMYMKYLNLLTQIKKQPDFQKERKYVSNTLGTNITQTKIMDRLQVLKDSLLVRYEEKNAKCPMEIEIVPKKEERSLIDCTTLSGMIRDKTKIIIMDCRLRDEYEESKIDYNFMINVPEDIIHVGMSANKIENSLPNESKVGWASRFNRSIIVFVDWNSKGPEPTRNSAIWHLKEILTTWDSDLRSKPEMLFLEGGYQHFKLLYPMMSINPKYEPPKQDDDSLYILDDIEYPSLDDIIMKDSSMTSSNKSIKIPGIDRSSKADAIKHYEDKNVTQLLEEQEKLANKSLQNEKDMMTTQMEIKKILHEKEDSICNDVEEKELLSTERQSLFRMMQLESKQKDYILEDEAIKDQLRIMREQDAGKTEPISDEVERRIQEKDLERKKLNEQREKEQEESAEQLRLARERKPLSIINRSPVKTPRSSLANELILSPKTLTQVPQIPHFDRNAKPTFSSQRQDFYNEQDFAPVYSKVERGLTGLKNLGNTCYMNSIIQCLSNTNTLTQYLLENTFEKHINGSNKTQGHIVRTVAAVIKLLWSGECKYISSKHLKVVIGEQDHLFYGMDQQDSHEFLIMLIDWLHSDLQTLKSHAKIPDQLPQSEKAWLEYTRARESFILHLFYGQIKSTVKCTECQKESYTYETFSNLSLELPQNSNRCMMQDCFNMYFHGERIPGWNCPHCKQPRDAIKKLDISKLPPILVIHFKRFYADPNASNSFRKKQILVEFPLSDMNMLPYVARSEKSNGSNNKHIYNLYGVSNHYGTMESGHYTAFCKNDKQKKWYKFDDHTVSSLDKSDVRSSAAYILFYSAIPDINNMISR